MQNLLKYFTNFGHVRSRHKKIFVFIFVLFLILFMAIDRKEHNELHHPDHSHRGAHFHSEDDTIISLKSQIAYLKRKLAKGNQESKVYIDDPSLPSIFAITPTYARPVQKAELTRLCHTFLLVPNFHWILIEDARAPTQLVTNFLANCGVSYTHLYAPTPPDWKLKDKESSWRKPRGVVQRNEGILWIRDNVKKGSSGVVYFADDDNTYSLDLFEEMRTTKKVSIFSVGLVGGLMVERPKVQQGKVIGWRVVWAPNRPFAVDMAGFAINLELLLERPKAKFAYQVKRGFQESEFLAHLVNISDLEVKGDLGKKVMVWHTRTEKAKLDMEKKLQDRELAPSDLGIEV